MLLVEDFSITDSTDQAGSFVLFGHNFLNSKLDHVLYVNRLLWSKVNRKQVLSTPHRFVKCQPSHKAVFKRTTVQIICQMRTFPERKKERKKERQKERKKERKERKKTLITVEKRLSIMFDDVLHNISP